MEPFLKDGIQHIILVESHQYVPKYDNYIMKTLITYFQFLHNSRLNVPTFVELYPFGTIKSIKEDDVRFWTLFKKCTMACSTSFCRNCLTSIINSPNILFCSFLPMFFGFSNLIDLYGQSISSLSQLLFVLFFQIINAPFPKEVEDKEEDRELPNSRMVVEVSLDEIPPTLGFDSQMPQVENVESPNSRTIVAINLDEIPSISIVNSLVPYSPIAEVSPFHVIFYLNEIMITTHFNKGFHTIIFCPKLKEFVEKCLV